MDRSARIRRSQSCASDERQAVQEFHAAVAQPDMALVVFFCSSQYDLEVVGLEISRLFVGVEVVGCTTAGEIGPAGSRDLSISGASFPSGSFTAVTEGINCLQRFEDSKASALAQRLRQSLERLDPGADQANSFAILLIDGLCVREEPVARAFQNALGRVPLVGGSAGDGLDFAATYVYFAGAFHADSAVLILVATRLPFTVFKTQHFVPAGGRVVVTAADAERRVVYEIDGWPAAEGYARVIGTEAGSLNPAQFAAQPMVVVIGGTNYVRSIEKVNPDGSLTFFCAIEEGLVLRAARGVDLVENLEQAFDKIRSEIGEPQLVIGFDCVLRKLEMAQTGLVSRVSATYRHNRVVGFNSYGEQFRGVHVNQTLTGIAVGEARDG